MSDEIKAESSEKQIADGSPAQPAGRPKSAADTPAPNNRAPREETGEERAGSSGESGESAQTAVRRRGKGSRSIPAGIAHIKATFNNTSVAITDVRGGVVAWSSGGRTGFKGSRKSTAFAATLVGQDAARQAVGRGMHEVEVRVQGAGSGRESAIRALQSSGLNISVIKDVTPIPHNGCRPRKRRRV